jgi:RNA polymerase sigma-70 factor (ECF subfamily)
MRTEIITEAIVRITDSDQELLNRALDGDEEAFTALYRQRQGPVYRFALQMTGSAGTAEDVTQEVFIVLLKQGRRFDPARGNLGSFLFGIARNMVLRRVEKNRAMEPVAEDFAGDVDLLGDLTQRETIEQVRRAVLSLPASYREAVVLCDLQDVSYQDAAVALDCPVGTVRSRLNRGRALLAQKLGAEAARSMR